MQPKRRRIRRRDGDILRIDLSDGTMAFGRVLEDPLVALYDARSAVPLPLDEIVAKPVAFKVWVMNYAIRDGIWPVLGHLPLEPALAEPVVFCKRDPITGAWSLYYGGGREAPCSLEQCLGKEVAAVWDPHHVVDRLEDHFAGRTNKWVARMGPASGSAQP